MNEQNEEIIEDEFDDFSLRWQVGLDFLESLKENQDDNAGTE